MAKSFMFKPDGKFRRYWEGLILILTTYISVEIPLRVVLDYPITDTLIYLDLGISIFFVVDIIFMLESNQELDREEQMKMFRTLLDSGRILISNN